MKTLLPIALFAMVVAFACGPKPPPEGPRKQNEIQALWTQIRDWRLEAGLSVEQPPSELIGIAPKTVKQVQQICPDNPAPPAVCSDVCSLADAICDNAEQICILANELGMADTWAQDKCTSAKGSCREGKKKCCAKCSETKVEPVQPKTPQPVMFPKPAPSTPPVKDHAS